MLHVVSCFVNHKTCPVLFAPRQIIRKRLGTSVWFTVQIKPENFHTDQQSQKSRRDRVKNLSQAFQIHPVQSYTSCPGRMGEAARATGDARKEPTMTSFGDVAMTAFGDRHSHGFA
jgi:hypothetical protein